MWRWWELGPGGRDQDGGEHYPRKLVTLFLSEPWSMNMRVNYCKKSKAWLLILACCFPCYEPAFLTCTSTMTPPAILCHTPYPCQNDVYIHLQNHNLNKLLLFKILFSLRYFLIGNRLRQNFLATRYILCPSINFLMSYFKYGRLPMNHYIDGIQKGSTIASNRV